MGVNVETGNATMSSPVLVYDFNGDGKAEVLLLTSEGTTFGNGTTIGDTNGDGVTDYNTHVYTDLYQVTMDNCPEFLSMVNGSTGAEIARTNFIPRGAKSTWTSYWGDGYGHRMSFIQATVAFVDGVTPSAVFSRGPGGVMDIVSWNFATGSFVQDWSWTARGKTFTTGTGWIDFHQVKAIDVDSDGKDEISWGSSMLDHNGTVKYTTALVHGDRFQIGDFDPNRAGLEAFAIQQWNSTLLGAALFDANTGSFLKTWYTSALADIGRGDVADIDPNTIGMELFSFASGSLLSCTGTDIATAHQYPDISIWWDGDLCRENFKGIGSSGYNPAINKWYPSTLTEGRIFTIYNDGGSYVVTCPYAGRAPFIGDVIGDWREEVILEASDHSQLRIYSTVIPAVSRIYTLMQNPAYRIDVTTKGYLCSKYPDYYLGTGMSTPPTPNITFPVPNGTYKLLAKHSGKAVDVLSCGTANGVNVQQTSDLGTTCQQWVLSNNGEGAYTFTNVNSSKVLDVYNCGTANKVNVQQWTNLNNNCQKWTLIASGNNYYQIKNVNSGKCLDVKDALTTDGANIQQYTCNGADCQKFLFVNLSATKSYQGIAKEEASAVTSTSIKLLSNPVYDNSMSLALNLAEKTEVAITVVDLSGRKVLSKKLGVLEGNKVQVIDVASLNTGIYILQIATSTKTVTIKFVRI
jgi:rhamnogalacturonan endolyase